MIIRHVGDPIYRDREEQMMFAIIKPKKIGNNVLMYETGLKNKNTRKVNVTKTYKKEDYQYSLGSGFPVERVVRTKNVLMFIKKRENTDCNRTKTKKRKAIKQRKITNEPEMGE